MFAGDSGASRPMYYGAPEETGLWRISIPKFEDQMSAALASRSFGESIEQYVFGFEIAELDGWGRFFKSTRNYVSYRPNSKTLVSVRQVDWIPVKDLPLEAQFAHLCEALLASIRRVKSMKRKPKDFDHEAFEEFVLQCLAGIAPLSVAG